MSAHKLFEGEQVVPRLRVMKCSRSGNILDAADFTDDEDGRTRALAQAKEWQKEFYVYVDRMQRYKFGKHD